MVTVRKRAKETYLSGRIKVGRFMLHEITEQRLRLPGQRLVEIKMVMMISTQRTEV